MIFKCEDTAIIRPNVLKRIEKIGGKTMYDINLNIQAVLVWYVLLVIGILLITLYASWKHSNPILFAWGLVIGILILWLKEYLAPIIFGVFNYSWETSPVLFVLTGTFAVVWFGYIALTLWNCVNEGALTA